MKMEQKESSETSAHEFQTPRNHPKERIQHSEPGLRDHPSYLCCPDALSTVGDPLSGKGCGSPNHIQF